MKVPVAPFLTACIIMSSAIPKQHKLRFLLGADSIRFLYPHPISPLCRGIYPRRKYWQIDSLGSWCLEWLWSIHCLNSEGPDFHPKPIFDEYRYLWCEWQVAPSREWICWPGAGHVTLNIRCSHDIFCGVTEVVVWCCLWISHTLTWDVCMYMIRKI